MKKLLLPSIIFILFSCWGNTPKFVQLNSNCTVNWMESNQAYVDETSPIIENINGQEVITNGFFHIDQNIKEIVVNSKSTDDVRIHEFCHLIDWDNGDYHRALVDLGSGYPPIIDKFVAYLDRHPIPSKYYHWAVLRDLYVGEDVVQHIEILSVIGPSKLKIPLNINK